MGATTHEDRLLQLAAAFGSGDLDVLAGVLGSDFWSYTPREGEDDQRQVFTGLAEKIRTGIPDATLVFDDLRAEGDELLGEVVLAGHCTGEIFGVPGRGQQYEVRGTVRSREGDDGLSLAFSGIDIVGNLRALGVLPYPTFAHEPMDPYPAIPEILVRLAFNGAVLAERACTHVDAIEHVEPTSDACAACVEVGGSWPALRQCLTCGHVGCCDASTLKHAKRHHDETGHPMVRSVMPGESWIWCYADSAILSSWHLAARPAE